MNKNEIYLGNKNLKRTDVKVEFTREEIQEYIKCEEIRNTLLRIM